MKHLDRLSRFEYMVRELLEGSFDRVLGRQPVADNIARELAKAIESNRVGHTTSGRYIVFLNPEAYSKLEPDLPILSHQLGLIIASTANDLRLELTCESDVDFRVDSNCKFEQIRVKAELLETQEQDTQIKPVTVNNLAKVSVNEADAFLIINGKRHISIDNPTTSIGRQLDNDIVLDERTVSRVHAQIRWRYGRFVLFDLGSSAGTLVNGERLEECVLQNGDVITLGNATIIFGHENFNHQQNRQSSEADQGWTRELIRDVDQNHGEE